MRVLWIATKVPVPPVDGGRLVQKLTLGALAAAGAEVTFVAPLFPGEDEAAVRRELADLCGHRASFHLLPLAPRGKLACAFAARPGGLPLALARHARAPLRRIVERVLASGPPFDVVHAEQLHALAQAEPALRRGVPVVLRAQNVESDLWRLSADGLAAPWRFAAALEARRLAQWEGAAVLRAAATVALTEEDAVRLRVLAAAVAPPGGQGNDGAHGTTVTVVPAPFPARRPSGPRPLPGSPAVVLLGSAGWRPNRDAERWMRRDVWPAVRRRVPQAVLHVFAGSGAGSGDRDEAAPGVVRHAAPADSAEAFASGAVLAVPLRVASGVRMKILEAWARGLPVVATPVAAAGLAAEDGRELLLAADAAGFAAALARLAAEPELAAGLVAAGRSALVRRHDPAAVAAELLRVYAAAAGRRAAAV